MKKPELLAPGGSFLSAYYAIEAGADGVYLGLTEFSARKAAANFTFDQLRRIRRLAADRGRKIYVTLNTIIRESELRRLADVVSRLEAAAVDGIIVQDLGVLWFLRRRFPGVPVHASTQMAVHTSAGIGFLKQLGVRRIILSRECTRERIRALRQAHPDVELEVFIHGGALLRILRRLPRLRRAHGRSGNRETVPRSAGAISNARGTETPAVPGAFSSPAATFRWERRSLSLPGPAWTPSR